MQTASIEATQFKQGLDTRKNVFSDTFSSFRSLINAVLTVNGNVRTRPPIGAYATLPASCDGFFQTGTGWGTIQPRGGGAPPTITPDITVYSFDIPDNCTADWGLVDYGLFRGIPYAWIRHATTSVAVPHLVYLHVWDGKPNLPTYVQDPALPCSFKNGFPLYPYSSGATVPIPVFQDWSPVSAAVVAKLHASNGDGTVQFSGIGRPRVWNVRTTDDIEKTGAMYYFVAPSSTSAVFIVPEVYSDLRDVTKFAAYVFEVLLADGTWAKVQEVASAPGAYQYSLSSATPAWATVSLSKITVNSLPDGAIVRFRALVVPEVTVIAGNQLNPAASTQTGDGVRTQFTTTTPFVAFTATTGAYTVAVGGDVKSTPQHYTVTDVSGIARVDFKSKYLIPHAFLDALTVPTPGAGYSVADVYAIVGGTGVPAHVTITSVATVGTVASLTLATNDTSVSTGLMSLQGPCGTVTIISVDSVSPFAGGINTWHLVSGGTGCYVGEHISGTGTVSFTVASITGGVAGGITAASVTTPGDYVSVPPSNAGLIPVTIAGTPGSGAATSLTFTMHGAVIDTGILTSDMSAGVAPSAPLQFVVKAGGTTLAVGTDYTIGPTPSSISIVGTVAWQGLYVALVPANNATVAFTPPYLAVSGGTVTYEGATVTSAAVPISALTASQTYTLSAGPASIPIYGGATHTISHATLTSDLGATLGLDRYGQFLLGSITTDASLGVTAQAAFQYAKDASTSWYQARHINNLINVQGVGECGDINFVGNNDVPRPLTAVIPTKNRLLICDAESSQLWGVDPDPTQNTYFGRIPYGSSAQGSILHEMPMIHSQRGIQAVPLVGLTFNGVDPNNIGEALIYLGLTNVTAGKYWPHIGVYVCFAVLNNPGLYADSVHLPADSVLRTNGQVPCFLFLTFSRESQIQGWSLNIIPGISSVNPRSFYAVADKFYFLSGKQVYCFDSSATVFQDVTDPAPIATQATTHFVHGGKPNRPKRLLWLAVAGNGVVTVTPSVQPWLNAGTQQGGPLIADLTYGQLKAPVHGCGAAISLDISGNDVAGFELQSLTLEILPLGR